MPGFNFGLVSAVSYFNAVPELTASATRRLLGVPTDHYFDDFDVVSLKGNGSASQCALGDLHALCGFPFSAKKHIECAEANKFLGVITDFTDLAKKGVVLLYVEEERRRKLLEELRSIRTKGLTPSQASKLTGKLQFTLS